MAAALRVLYLHHVGEIGGAENSLRLLLRHLDRRDVVPLFGGPAAGPFPEALAAMGVPLLPVTFGRLRETGTLLRAASRVRALIREHRVDLVHSNGPQTNVPGALAARWAGIPAIWHLRNLLTADMWDVDRMLARLATRIVCNADAIRERFRGSGAWARSVTVMNAVDTREFNPQVPREPFRREMGLSPGEPAVGIVGRISQGKGHEYFVEAAIRLIRAGHPGTFLIVGDTRLAGDAGRDHPLRRQVAEAGLGDRIRFTGFRRDVPSVMRGLDVAVLASDAEPCGRVLFEAMASGTALVATGTGGTPEVVRDGQEGLLVPPRDAAALAGAIGRLLAEPDLRARLGAAGAVRARTEFPVERQVERILRVYAEARGSARREGATR